MIKVPNHCSVTRAYEIADSAMFEQFMAHSTIDAETGLRVRSDDAADDAARWLIARGMARARDGLIEITDGPTANDDA